VDDPWIILMTVLVWLTQGKQWFHSQFLPGAHARLQVTEDRLSCRVQPLGAHRFNHWRSHTDRPQ
jgi:hypothetical protein